MTTVFQAFSVGKDMGLKIQLKNIGGLDSSVYDISDIGYLEDFDAQQKHSTIQIKPISHGGASRFRDKYEHWEGSFTIARTGPLTDLLIQVLQDSLVGSTNGSPLCTLTQTIVDPSGAGVGTLTFIFDNAVLTPSGGGKYTGDSAVNQTFTFMAPIRYLSDMGSYSITDVTGGNLLAMNTAAGTPSGI